MSTASRSLAGLGFRAHSGWAAAVALAGDLRSPIVIDRRRIELADRTITGSVQPFHAAQGLDLRKAGKLIQRHTESTQALADRAFCEMIDDLSAKGFRAAGTGILLASGRPVGSLESTLASHAMIHTAEGEFFRQAIRQASEKCSLPVTGIKEREIFDRCSKELKLSSSALQQRTGEMGKSLGPPWRQDEKLAALAAWLVLASSER